LRYTLPAFLVPLAFTLRADGLGLLLQAPWAMVATSLLAAVGLVIAGVAAASGHLIRPLTPAVRGGFAVAGLLLLLS
jgi:TRAP-type uncharacterized transport system fused permease subunit